MIRVLLIPTDADPEIREIVPSLEVLKSLVGGWLENVTLTPDAHMYVNDEGKILGLPINKVATLLVRYFRTGWPDVIAGPAVVLGTVPDGEEGPCPQEILALFDAGPVSAPDAS